MKCIRDKCRYYRQHEFKESCMVCTASYKIFDKRCGSIDCLIEDIISDLEDTLVEFDDYSRFILKNQED